MSARRGKAPTSPVRVRHADRMARALVLRIAGKSTPEIARELDISRVTAWRLITEALAVRVEEIGERANELRALEAERLDELSATLWPLAMAGDLGAVDRYLRTRESYRRLLNLDLREGVDATPQVVVIDARPPWSRDEGIIDGTVVEMPPGLPALTEGDS